MKVFVVIIFTLCTLQLVLANVQHEHEQDLQDNEFAEFEDFDEEADSPKETKSTEGKLFVAVSLRCKGF